MKSNFLDDIIGFILEKKIVSISGESGTGKTTLALQLVSSILLKTKPDQYQCLWFQASEKFPKKRLASMFKDKVNLLTYLVNNIFVIPDTVIKTYSEQFNLLNQFEEKDLPLDIKVIVIDNISHHLRYELSQKNDLGQISTIKNRFYDKLLFPLIMYCQREEIVLLLIHEVSTDIESGLIKPYYASLYNRINGAHMSLVKQIFNDELIMKFSSNKICKNIKYKINNEGLVIS
ncbi:MAG: AAA family ATPase [Promethearchaeota archaeon]